MIVYNDKYRSKQEEVMDDLDFQGAEMKNLLHDLKTVNKWLGGNSITLDGISKLLKNHSSKKPVKILDVGCGDGELLRKCLDFATKNHLDFECVGLDFNDNILEYAKKQSEGYKTIKFKKVDVFLDAEMVPNCDIALCTLFLHHFNDTEIEALLKNLLQKSSKGLIINDLHRNKFAFWFFKVFHGLFLNTKTAWHDGLVSIARGFKKEELEAISKKIPNQQSTISWRWAYRYQWILKKNI